MEELCPKGSGAPPHTHDQDESFYIIEGNATFLIPDRTITASAGSFVWVPRGTVHGFRVDSDTCRLLNMYSPAGFERVIAATASSAEALTLPPASHVTRHTPEHSPYLESLLVDVGTLAIAVSDPLRP